MAQVGKNFKEKTKCGFFVYFSAQKNLKKDFSPSPLTPPVESGRIFHKITLTL
jgi:hypothetical protein